MATLPFAGLVDPFNGPKLNRAWWPFVDGSYSVEDGELTSSGTVNLTCPGGAHFDSPRTDFVAFSGRHAYIEAVVDAGMYGGLYLISNHDWDNYIGFDVYGDGSIELYLSSDGSALWTDTYDPEAHRFIGFFEEAGTLAAKVSADGVNWTAVWSGSAPAWMTTTGVWTGSAVDGSPGTSDAFHLYGFNCATQDRAAATFYVLSGGDDDAAGTSPETAWATVARVNAAFQAAEFIPGDTIRFEAGKTFAGPLVVAQEATPEAPISILSTVLGVPATIAVTTGHAVLGVDVGGIEIFDIDAEGDDHEACGILFLSTAYDYDAPDTDVRHEHLILGRCSAHGFAGQGQPEVEGTYRGYGITVRTTSRGFAQGWDHVRITAPHVYDCSDHGIRVVGNLVSDPGASVRSFTDVRIDTGHVHDIYGHPGTDGSLDELTGVGIRITDADDAVIERCRVYDIGLANGSWCIGQWLDLCYGSSVIRGGATWDVRTQSAHDGTGFALDNTDDAVIEFCYSRHCDGAGFQIVASDFGPSCDRNTIRFCVSEDDGRKNAFPSFNLSVDVLFNPPSYTPVDNVVHNCTVYRKSHADDEAWSALIYLHGMEDSKVLNNLLYSEGGAPFVALGDAEGLDLRGNAYFATGQSRWVYNWVAGPPVEVSSLEAFRSGTGLETDAGTTDDPKLVGPGLGTAPGSTDALRVQPSAYRLRSGSPMPTAGIDLDALGVTTAPVEDFFRAVHPAGSFTAVGADIGGPLAAFDVAMQGLVAQATDRSTPGPAEAPIVEWDWEVRTSESGSAILTSSARNPTFSLPSAGLYWFALTVTDSNGSTGSGLKSMQFGSGYTAPPYTDTPETFSGRILIADDDGEMREYKSRLVSYEITDDYDQPGAECSLVLWRDAAAGSIAPGITASPLNRNAAGEYAPAIYANRRCVIQKLNETDPIFDGYIRRVDPASARMKIWAPDRMNRLMRRKVKEQKVYSYPSGISLELLIQTVMDDVMGPPTQTDPAPGAPILYTPVSPNFTVTEWTLEKGSLGQQLIDLVLHTTGWKLRYTIDEGDADEGWENTGAFRLTLFEPPRDNETPNHTFAAKDWVEIARHETTDEDVRNEIFGGWHQNGVFVAATPVVDYPSQQRFDVVPLGIISGPGDPIDTESEWNTVANAALHDLRDPPIEATREGPYNDDVRIMQLLRFAADDKREDDSDGLDQGVKRVTHFWSATRKRTTVDTRGSVAGATKGWLRRPPGRATETPPIGSGGGAVEPDKQPPLFDYATFATTTTGTLWFKIQERGIAVPTVQARIKPSGEAWSAFATPTRGPGDSSVVKGGTLGPGEYEQDVTLSGSLVSQIHARCTLETGEVVTITIASIDSDSNPKFISVEINGTTVVVTCDDDTKSVGIEHLDGSYADEEDGNEVSFSVPVPEDETWDLRLTAYSTTIADRGDPGELSTTYDIEVGNTGVDANIEIPYPTITPPSLNSGEYTIKVKADASPSGYTYRVYRRYAVLGTNFQYIVPWTNWEEITSQLSPQPSSLPTSEFSHTVGSPWVRVAADDSIGTVFIRTEAAIYDSDGDFVSRYSKSPDNPTAYDASWPVSSAG